MRNLNDKELRAIWLATISSFSYIIGKGPASFKSIFFVYQIERNSNDIFLVIINLIVWTNYGLNFFVNLYFNIDFRKRFIELCHIMKNRAIYIFSCDKFSNSSQAWSSLFNSILFIKTAIHYIHFINSNYQHNYLNLLILIIN